MENNYLVDEVKCFSASPCVHEWHRRLAHRNLRDIKHLSEFGLTITRCNCSDQCDSCMKGKSTALPFPDSIKPDSALDIIVSDVCGPFNTQSIGGSRYFLTITDVFSDYTEVKFLRHKHEAKDHIINFVEFTKTQLSKRPKIYRTDGGGEFVNIELQNYLKREGIRIETTVPNTPQQNGIAERKNRTLNDSVRTLLIASNLPKYLWAEAMNNVVYTQNRIVRKNRKFAPIELFFNKKARATFIEFGKPVYVTTAKQGRSKLEPRAEIMKFLSVDDNAKGFRLWNGSKIVIERNIRSKADLKLNYRTPLSETVIKTKSSFNHCDKLCDEISDRNSSNNLSKDSDDSSLSEEIFSSIPRRSNRLIEKNLLQSANTSTDNDPKTFKQAVNSSDKLRWMEAMNEELLSLSENGTYELADLPNDKKAIGCKWVFKRKTENNSIRYKARLVAKGFNQRFGEDYDEVFAPVARASTIRLLLSMAGKMKLHVRQLDVKTAFLNGKLEEEIYMIQPEGFKIGNQMLRLRKSLYGLKQAARSWNLMLKECLEKVGFEQSDADDCFFKKIEGKHVCFVVVHVDDMLFAASNMKIIENIFQSLSSDFTLKDLGPVKQFLGVDIYESNGLYGINQSTYISKIAKELELENAKPQKYPLQPGYFKLECNEPLPDNTKYRKVIGMLLYVSTNSRPDISLSVCVLA